MAITFDTKYPAALKNAAWQKKKSFKDKAKSKTKTGLGQALLDAEAAWKLIKFDRLIAAKQGVGKGTQRPLTNLQAIRAEAEKYLNTSSQPVQKAIAALDKAASKARTTAKNPALSTTAKTAATALSGKLTAQAKLLRDITLGDFDEVIVRLDVNLTQTEGQHTEMLHAMDDVVDKLRYVRTPGVWGELNILQYLNEGMRISQILADRDGDKTWKETNLRWRRLITAHVETERKVKTLPPQYAVEAIKEFVDRVQSELGNLWV